MGNTSRQIKRNQQKTVDAGLKYLDKPCTIQEVVQIARGVAEDTVTDYHKHQGTLYVALSLQLEILKDAVIAAGIITEEEFQEKYVLQAEEFNEMQRKMMEVEDVAEVPEDVPTGNPTMEISANDIEIRRE